ncbi:Hypothetical predicted protein [Marmota monax]|uniref:Uncharacterized protein n=1 Tax=Marmota monax TaxID=9995 RepID=A0A5E4A5A5_MARMO|nr:Hypothetical predicted protein [Marmota monax]
MQAPLPRGCHGDARACAAAESRPSPGGVSHRAGDPAVQSGPCFPLPSLPTAAGYEGSFLKNSGHVPSEAGAQHPVKGLGTAPLSSRASGDPLGHSARWRLAAFGLRMETLILATQK